MTLGKPEELTSIDLAGETGGKETTGET